MIIKDQPWAPYIIVLRNGEQLILVTEIDTEKKTCLQGREGSGEECVRTYTELYVSPFLPVEMKEQVPPEIPSLPDLNAIIADPTRLDIAGWRPVLYITDGVKLEEVPNEEHPDYMADAEVLRVEFWIVAGDQYIFTAQDSEEMWEAWEFGEYDDDEARMPTWPDDLAEVIIGALQEGREVHPFLARAVEGPSAEPPSHAEKPTAEAWTDQFTIGKIGLDELPTKLFSAISNVLRTHGVDADWALMSTEVDAVDMIMAHVRELRRSGLGSPPPINHEEYNAILRDRSALLCLLNRLAEEGKIEANVIQHTLDDVQRKAASPPTGPTLEERKLAAARQVSNWPVEERLRLRSISEDSKMMFGWYLEDDWGWVFVTEEMVSDSLRSKL